MEMKMMSGSTILKLGATVGVGLLLAQGCKIVGFNADHCTNNDGDAHCAELFPDGSRPYCETAVGECLSGESINGCVSARPLDECYTPCGGRQTIDENDECVMMEESSSGSSSGGTDTDESSGSGSSSSTTGPMPCMMDEECTEPEAPFCGEEGECGTCDQTVDGDMACAGANPDRPVCLEDQGECVECRMGDTAACDAQALVCNEDTNICVPCTEHEQCGEAACNLFDGTCLPSLEDGDVVHVGGPMSDFNDLNAAVASFAAGAQGTIIVHQADYNEALTVDGGRTLAFLANDGDLPLWVLAGGGSPQLTVADGTVLVDGLRLSGNANDVAVVVDGGRAWLDRSRIVQNSGGGIVASNGAELTVRNCFVGGGNANGVAAMQVDGASSDIIYSSFVGGFASATALACNAPLGVTVRNSILAVGGANDAVSCPEATITTTATEEIVGAFDGSQAWFADYLVGDFSLTTMGAST
ncbi:MAG: right-handed parallel beta-helix repeat-containing protein, partial [Nannocystaceae bacterium]